MSPVSEGRWDIESMVVNSEKLMNYAGFEWLETNRTKIAIQPAGLHLVIESQDAEKLTLMSRGQLFFATCWANNSRLTLKLTRPKSTETIEINARINDVGSSESVERELVQV